MTTVTPHQAKTDFYRLLRDVSRGETVVMAQGGTPVAKLTAIDSPEAIRPPVGTVTSGLVAYNESVGHTHSPH